MIEEAIQVDNAHIVQGPSIGFYTISMVGEKHRQFNTEELA